MPNYQKRIVYLSDEQREELFTEGTITVNGTTVVYNDNDMYVTPQEVPYVKPANGIPASDLAADALVSKADKNNTTITGSLSMYRKADTAVGGASTAIGGYNTASGMYSTAFGNSTVAAGAGSFATGTGTEANGAYSVVEGYSAYANGNNSHAAGEYTKADGMSTFARGKANALNTTAIYPEWTANTQYNEHDHVTVTTEENGETVVKIYSCAIANNDSAFTSSKWEDVTAYMDFVDIVGNGRNGTERSNAYALDWAGNGHFMGDVYVGCNANSSGGTKLVKDVQINGSSIVQNGIANVPIANAQDVLGLTRYGTGWTGILVNSTGYPYIARASDTQVKTGTDTYKPIVSGIQHQAVFYGLAKAAGDTTQSASSNAVGTYTDDAKTAIQTMLGVENGVSYIENISGTTPAITGEANTRYMCGEVTSISITPPNVGTIDVVFTSGSTPTVLTVPNTVIFPAWFNSASLEPNTTYELNIMDGIYGAVMAW